MSYGIAGKWLAIAIVSSSVVVLGGCNQAKKAEQGAKELANKAGAEGEKLADQASASASATMSTASNASATLTDLAAEPLTDDNYQKLIVGLAPCKIDRGTIDIACPAQHTYTDAQKRARKANIDISPLSIRAGKKFLNHNEPSVRAEAIHLLGLEYDKDPAIPELLITAAKQEKNPDVQRALVRVFGSHAIGDEHVQTALLAFTESEDAKVRQEAGEMLSLHKNRTFAAGVKKVGDLMQNDPVWAVRYATCQSAGMLSDDSLLPIYEKLTSPAMVAKDARLASSCLTGLARMWMPIANWETPSEKAYRMTLAVLQRKPANYALPSLDLVLELGMVGDASIAGHAQWAKKATWWKPEVMRAILGATVVDEHASLAARMNSIDSIVRIGGDLSSLQSLRKSLGEKPTGESARVAEKLELAAAPKK